MPRREPTNRIDEARVAAGHEGLADGESRLHMPGRATTGDESEDAPVSRATRPAGFTLPRRRFGVRRDTEQQPDAHERDDQGRAAIGDEGKGDARHGQGVDHTADVDHGLSQDPAGDPDGDKAREGVALAGGDPEAGPAEGAEAEEHDEGADEAEVAGDDRKDEVGVGVGQKAPGRHRRPEPAPGDPAEAERGERLHDLVARGRGVRERIDDRGQAVAAVAGRHGHEGAGRQDQDPGREQQAQARAGGEEHREGDAAEHDGRPEVGLLDDEDGRRDMKKNRGRTKACHWSGRLPRRASMSAAKTTRASFISSDGWSWIGPTPIHRLEPPAKWPKPGRKTTTRRQKAIRGSTKRSLRTRPMGVRLTISARAAQKPCRRTGGSRRTKGRRPPGSPRGRGRQHDGKTEETQAGHRRRGAPWPRR